MWYSSTYLAMGFANVRAGTQKRRRSQVRLAQHLQLKFDPAAMIQRNWRGHILGSEKTRPETAKPAESRRVARVLTSKTWFSNAPRFRGSEYGSDPQTAATPGHIARVHMESGRARPEHNPRPALCGAHS